MSPEEFLKLYKELASIKAVPERPKKKLVVLGDCELIQRVGGGYEEIDDSDDEKNSETLGGVGINVIIR